MKLRKILTLSLATCVCTATISVGSAFAAEQTEETLYPDSFECSLSFDGELTDYAVFGDNYAFAYNGQLAVLNSDEHGQRFADIEAQPLITALEYSSQGELYVCFEDGYCVYPDMEKKLPLSQITVQDKEQWDLRIGNSLYTLNLTTGQLRYSTGTVEEYVTPNPSYEGEVKFSRLKKYDDNAYAVLNNCLYKMEGATAVKVEPTYYDLNIAKSIHTGNAAIALKSDSPILYGWIEKNRYYTQIDLESEWGATFKVAQTANATRLSEDTLYCTILAESGNAYIVTMDGKCYLTAKTSVRVEATPPALTDTEVKTAYAIEKTGIYSRPYLSNATKLGELESGSSNAVTVLGQYTDLTGMEFYKITYVDKNGTSLSGYVAKRRMTAYAFPAEDEEEHQDGGDKQFVYDSNVVTVILAVAIVALVLIAIMYIGIASSKSKKGKKKKYKAQQKKIADREKRDLREEEDAEE